MKLKLIRTKPISNKKWNPIGNFHDLNPPSWTIPDKKVKIYKIQDPTWEKRNNSDNISGVLNSNYRSPKRRNQKTRNPSEKVLSSQKSCHCHEKKIAPKLFKKSVDQIKSKNVYDCETLYRNKKSMCNATSSQDYRTENKSSYRDYRDDLKESSNYIAGGPLNYTEQRKTYENIRKKNIDGCPCLYHLEAEEFYRKYFNISKDKYANKATKNNSEPNMEAEILFKLDSKKFVETPYMSSVTFRSRSENDDQFENISQDNISEKTVQNIKSFRDKNYLETHNVDKEYDTIPEHECVYRFSLDNRFAAVSENPNEYGLNSCIICHKPMRPWTKKKLGPLEMLSKTYGHPLTPKDINLGTEANIEMLLTKKDIQLFNDCFKVKMQRPMYKNSLALRQQRMLGSVLPV